MLCTIANAENTLLDGTKARTAIIVKHIGIATGGSYRCPTLRIRNGWLRGAPTLPTRLAYSQLHILITDFNTCYYYALVCMRMQARYIYTVVFLCVCVDRHRHRHRQLLKDQSSASKSFYRLLVMFSWILIRKFAK